MKRTNRPPINDVIIEPRLSAECAAGWCGLSAVERHFAGTRIAAGAVKHACVVPSEYSEAVKEQLPGILVESFVLVCV